MHGMYPLQLSITHNPLYPFYEVNLMPHIYAKEKGFAKENGVLQKKNKVLQKKNKVLSKKNSFANKNKDCKIEVCTGFNSLKSTVLPAIPAQFF